MNIQEEITKGQNDIKKGIQDTLAPTFDELKDEISKAKKAQVGEVHEWGGKKYMKVANGWIPADKKHQHKLAEDLSSGGKKGAKGEGEQSSKVPPEVLAEHAKSASETALSNATKMSTDPEVRAAAHKELMRRKNEEAQETFKAPEDGANKQVEDKSKQDAATPKRDEYKESVYKYMEKHGIDSYKKAELMMIRSN